MRKLHVDFWRALSLDSGMINLDEIDPQKARAGLFALLTAGLEDSHEVAVRGQRPEIDHGDMVELLEELVDQISRMEILIMAIGAMRE